MKTTDLSNIIMNTMEENEIYTICEAVAVRNAMNEYMAKIAREYQEHDNPDYLATMRFLGHVYRKFAKVAAQRVTTDEMGRTVLRRDIRSNFDLN